MKWENLKKENDLTKIPNSWLYTHYYEALNILFRIENTLRVFVYIILKKNYKNQWSTTNMDYDGKQKNIDNIVKVRIQQAENFGYLSYQPSCPILHLSTGELIDIITSASEWPHFKKYFPGNMDIIKYKFAEIISIRNSLAHFRPIKHDDVALVKQNAKHILLNIENELFEIIASRDTVPTNCTKNWYQELKHLGTENCTLTFKQSSNESWVQLSIKFNCLPVKDASEDEGFAFFQILNIITPNILKEFPHLTNELIFLSESANHQRFNESIEKTTFSKLIYLFFNEESLGRDISVVKEQLIKLFDLIERESNLIRQDNLARGRIIQTERVWASLNKSENKSVWKFNINPLYSGLDADNPLEFWGKYFDLYERHFISSTPIFPWMSVKISEESLPW